MHVLDMCKHFPIATSREITLRIYKNNAESQKNYAQNYAFRMHRTKSIEC